MSWYCPTQQYFFFFLPLSSPQHIVHTLLQKNQQKFNEHLLMGWSESHISFNEQIGKNWKFNEYLLMGWCKSHISLTLQFFNYKWFSLLPHQQILIFVDFFYRCMYVLQTVGHDAYTVHENSDISHLLGQKKSKIFLGADI